MAHKHESRLSELIGEARQMNIEVRTEKLLREVGYRARSGRCRVNENWSRQKNGDAQKFCNSHDFPLLENEIGVPFGCNVCMSRTIRNISSVGAAEAAA